MHNNDKGYARCYLNTNGQNPKASNFLSVIMKAMMIDPALNFWLGGGNSTSSNKVKIMRGCTFFSTSVKLVHFSLNSCITYTFIKKE